MSETIPSFFLESKRFWGMFITAASQLVPVLAGLFGHDVSADDVNQFGAAVTAAIEAIGTVVGLALTFWGAMAAKGPMTMLRA